MVILTVPEQKEALNIVRKTIISYVFKRFIPRIDSPFQIFFREKFGVFVTIRRKSGELRGCIGVFEPDKPLMKTLQDMAVSASSNDFRFLPITTKELDDIQIELSIISPLRRIHDWHEIKLGKEGVFLKKGGISATYLPQVANEHNMSLEEFLESLCEEKARIPRYSYKDTNVELFVYDVQIIEERLEQIDLSR